MYAVLKLYDVNEQIWKSKNHHLLSYTKLFS